MDSSAQFFAGEVEERGAQQGEHENAEEVAGGEWTHDFGAEGKEVGGPGKSKDRGDPVRDAAGNFGILQEGNHDAEEAEDTSGSDKARGVQRAGAGFAFVFLLRGGFDEQADQSADKHGGGGAKRKIGTRGKREGAHAKNFHG